jgi:hypothetical protein
MAKSLIPLTIGAPGFLGLNTQQSGSILPTGWATKLDNFVYDDVGRIASRNGSKHLHATVITNTPTIKAYHEYIDASGNVLHIFAADNKIFKEVSGTITDISGSITTPTDDLWQFANFNGWCVGHQLGHAPIILTTTGGTFIDGTGTMHNGDMVLSAYGRAWTAIGNTLYHTDLLIHDFTGGSSGNFDLAKFWPNGMDEAVALADFNGLLIVFGKESIIIYENADDVDNMTIIEGIKGIGCIARDSVQTIGKEIVFLSSTGLRTLGRTVLEESMPLTDVSQHVRDEVLNFVASETKAEIKSVFNRTDGFYLLSLPTSGKSFMFDLKFPNQDRTWKAATWSIAPTALLYTQDLQMFMGVQDGWINKYQNYKDNILSNSTGGTTFDIDFEGVWNDFGEEVASFIKIPKQVSVLGAGTSGTAVVFKWAMDYSSTFTTRNLAFTTVPPAQYGIAQYDIDVYSSTGEFERIVTQLARTGQVMKVGLKTTIDGNKFALQRIDVLVKLGKLGL